MNNLPRVIFKLQENYIEGDLLGLVSVPFTKSPNQIGYVEVTYTQGGYWDGTQYIGGFTETATVYAIVGADDGVVHRVPYHSIKYIAKTKPAITVGFFSIKNLAEHGHVELEDASLIAASDLYGTSIRDLESLENERKKYPTLLATLRKWTQRQWMALQDAKSRYLHGSAGR